MGHRHYDASLGRFLSRDPIGFAGGLNLYEYASSSPVDTVDPDGLTPYKVLGWIFKTVVGDPDPLPSDPHAHIVQGKALGKFKAEQVAGHKVNLATGEVTRAHGGKVGEVMGILKKKTMKEFKRQLAENGVKTTNTPKGSVKIFSKYRNPALAGLGVFLSLNEVAQAEPCNKTAVALSETENHVNSALIGAGIMSTTGGKAIARAIWASPIGRAIVVGTTSYSSTRQLVDGTETGRTMDDFYTDFFYRAFFAP